MTLPFVHPDDGLVVLFTEHFQGVNVGSFPELDVAIRLPYVSIEVIDGNQDFFQDDPIVNIDTFHRTRAEAKNLAAEVSDLLLGYPWTVKVGARRYTIDRVGVIRRPVKEPWDDESVRRIGATYQLAARR